MRGPADRRILGLGAAMALVLVVVLVLVFTSDAGGHRIRLTLPEATGLIPGFDVRMAGEPVGSVTSVKLTPDYKAAVELKIDDTAWPLPSDSIFRERLGGTIKYSDRFIEIEPGDSSSELPENAVVPASSYRSAVEFDDLFNAFGRETRTDLAATVKALGAAAPPVEKNLPRALEHGPEAAESAQELLAQLGDDPQALDALVDNTATVARSIADADPGLGDLITGARDTFTAVAAQSQDLESTLEEAPSTLAAATHTASRVDTTLRAAHDLTNRLKPGVARLQTLASPLNHLLRAVVDVGPDARATLSTLDKATPDLDTLLERARAPFMGQVESISRQAEPQLACIRPFSPEIAGVASTWADFWGSGDDHDKFFRAQVGIHPTMNETPLNVAQYQKLLPKGSFQYAFPQPPGQNVDQPWFQPQCGITKDALDPSKDPEADYTSGPKKLFDFKVGK